MAEKKFVQREKRFEVGPIKNFEAVVCRGESDETVFFADLLDFSKSGLKFRLPFCARFDEKLKIRLSFKNSEIQYHGCGRVRHIRNTDVNRWIVGCSIEPGLSDQIVGFLAESTQQERRRNPRLDVNSVGALSRQGQLEEITAQIRNVSKGGFCLLVGESHELGSQVNFTIDNRIGYQEKIPARIRWQKKIGDGFLIGLAYAENDSYERLVDCLEMPGQSSNSLESISWQMVVCALIAMLLPSLSYLLLGAGATQPENGNKINNVTLTRTTKQAEKVFESPIDDATHGGDVADSDLVSATSVSVKADPKPVTGKVGNAANTIESILPPRELTKHVSVAPRRLRNRDSENQVAGTLIPVPEFLQNKKPLRRTAELHGKANDQETTRRGERTRDLQVPSEVIRKRLMNR